MELNYLKVNELKKLINEFPVPVGVTLLHDQRGSSQEVYVNKHFKNDHYLLNGLECVTFCSESQQKILNFHNETKIDYHFCYNCGKDYSNDNHFYPIGDKEYCSTCYKHLTK